MNSVYLLIIQNLSQFLFCLCLGNLTMWWEMSGDRGDKWLNGVLPTWSANPYKVTHQACSVGLYVVMFR